jgi:putative selenium metabolism hydrolase
MKRKSIQENLGKTVEILYRKMSSRKAELGKFLRSIVAMPSESRHEAAVVERIGNEMNKAGFDDVFVDGMGNILGRMGSGKRIIAMDAHIDTVGAGNLSLWKFNPHKGKIENGCLYGRGAVDQKAGMASLIFAARLIKEYELLADCTLYVVGSVQEEDCDGLCWQYIIKEDGIRPECVVITEPTNLKINIGHRGRMEIEVVTSGKAAHASAPERGLNAIYSMIRIIREIESLNDVLSGDSFLGKGTIAVTDIKCKTPSLCAVPDGCSIHLDRRLAVGDNRKSALKEVRDAVKRAGVKAEIRVPLYELPSYTDVVYPTECYFPTWLLPKKHPLLRAAQNTCKSTFGKRVEIGKWIFSTNGVATMGKHRIPSIGFGPGEEKYAHSAEERVPLLQVLNAAVWYAMFPLNYTLVMEGNNHA